jgi:hypothetical protein
MNRPEDFLNEAVLIPDLLQAYPQARPVLDRYGLRGCGGPLGPRETLGFFAKAHDVPIERLLHEIRDCLERPSLPVASPAAGADTIYQPFFKAGIAVVLTLGGVWGAYLLARIGLAGSFTAVGLHEVNAHGQAQIFGWVGLFVMGFAYQAFPRFKHADLAYPRLAFASLWLMLSGLVLRSIAEPFLDMLAWAWLPALAGATLEIAAAGLFVWVIAATWRGSGKSLALYDYYILSALVWFVIQAVYEMAYLSATAFAGSREQLLDLVATWQGALREIQIHGFALLMILGVSQRLFHHFYDLPEPHRRISLWALIALNAAVLGEVTGLILMRTAAHGWGALWYGSVLLLAGSAGLLVRDWHIFAPTAESDRSLKFLRAAYLWLFVSLAMLVLLPVYQYGVLGMLAPDSAASRMGFSHAYYGAVRHAITVGFISLMIVGVAAKVVPTLKGLDVRALSPLWGPFVLINLGCGLRVAGQTLTDLAPVSFPVAGVSGLLEVLGLAWWGVHLWLIMAGLLKVPSPPEHNAAGLLVAGDPIEATNLVGQVLDLYPELLPVFLDWGFKPLAYALFRKALAYRVTIVQACRRVGVDLTPFLEALNKERRATSGTTCRGDPGKRVTTITS